MSQGKADLCPHPPSMPPPEHLLGKHQKGAAKKRPFQQTLAAGKKQKSGQKWSGPRPLPIGMTPSDAAKMNQKGCQKGSAHKASQAKASGQSAKNNPQRNWNKPPPLNLLEWCCSRASWVDTGICHRAILVCIASEQALGFCVLFGIMPHGMCICYFVDSCKPHWNINTYTHTHYIAHAHDVMHMHTCTHTFYCCWLCCVTFISACVSPWYVCLWSCIVCVCVCVCVYICLHKDLCHTHRILTCMAMCSMCVRIHLHMVLRIHLHMCVHPFVSIHVQIHAWRCALTIYKNDGAKNYSIDSI